MFTYGCVLFTIVDHEYKFLAKRINDSSFTFFKENTNKEISREEMERIVSDSIGIKATIDKWYSIKNVEYPDKSVCNYFVGQFEELSFDHKQYELFNYLQMMEALYEECEKDLLSECNLSILVRKAGDSYISKTPWHYDFKRIPYIPLDEKAINEVKECIKEYKDSKYYEGIYNCAKTIRFLYGDTHCLSDYQHNDRKYLNDLLFHICFWYPSYLDMLESEERAH